MRIAFAIATILLAAPAVEAAEKLPHFPKNAPYDEARTSLKALGWNPVKQEPKRCDTTGCYDRCAPGFEQRCSTWTEAEICRGTGSASCEFVWQRGDTVIMVRTTGEDDWPAAGLLDTVLS